MSWALFLAFHGLEILDGGLWALCGAGILFLIPEQIRVALVTGLIFVEQDTVVIFTTHTVALLFDKILTAEKVVLLLLENLHRRIQEIRTVNYILVIENRQFLLIVK